MSVSLQLYSMRNGESFETLLPKLPAAGISKVEAYGDLFADPATFLSALEGTGVSVSGCHMGIDYIEEDPAAAVAVAKQVGAQQVFAPYLEADQRPTTADGYAELARRLDRLGQPFRDAGLTFGWHNHDFELVALPDGSIPLDVMFSAAPDLAWEADLAWVIKGGADAMTYIERYGSRIAAVHVKDIAPEGENADEDGWADLGAGTVDWTALISACRALPGDVEFILEHDNPKNPFQYAANSAQAFHKIWEATNG